MKGGGESSYRGKKKRNPSESLRGENQLFSYETHRGSERFRRVGERKKERRPGSEGKNGTGIEGGKVASHYEGKPPFFVKEGVGRGSG